MPEIDQALGAGKGAFSLGLGATRDEISAEATLKAKLNEVWYVGANAAARQRFDQVFGPEWRAGLVVGARW